MSKETNAYVECPDCKARQDYSGVDIGELDLIPLPIHAKTEDPEEQKTQKIRKWILIVH